MLPMAMEMLLPLPHPHLCTKQATGSERVIILGYKYAKQGFVATLPYSGLKMDVFCRGEDQLDLSCGPVT